MHRQPEQQQRQMLTIGIHYMLCFSTLPPKRKERRKWRRLRSEALAWWCWSRANVITGDREKLVFSISSFTSNKIGLLLYIHISEVVVMVIVVKKKKAKGVFFSLPCPPFFAVYKTSLKRMHIMEPPNQADNILPLETAKAPSHNFRTSA